MTHSAKKRCSNILFVATFVLASVTAHAADLSQWLSTQVTYSTQAMLRNIGPSKEIPDAAPGSVVASPSFDPYYRYCWIRDAALTMDTVVDLYERASDAGEKSRYFDLLTQYVDFSRKLQLTPNPSGDASGFGLGEPKFNVDGSAFTGPWARPQNDGPALRARTLIRFARLLLDMGRADLVRQRLYDQALPARTVIKADLEFVAHHWRDASFDLWEEEKGDHFYTRMAQHRAMIEGADLAELLGDGGAASFYRQQASDLEQAIARHWDANRGYLNVTLNHAGGLDYKSSGLDVAIVLAALHAAPIPENREHQQPYFGPADDRILTTADHISAAFRIVFPINSKEKDWENLTMAPGIGRYPEDRYSGTESSQQGNPWFLATQAFAELYYRTAQQWEAQGSIPVTAINLGLLRNLRTYERISVASGDSIGNTDPRFYAVLRGLREQGDSYLRRARFHVDPNGPMSEQFNRYSGYMQSARELTWSHASVLTTAWARSN